MGQVRSNKMNLNQSARAMSGGRQRQYMASVVCCVALVVAGGIPVSAWSGEIYAPPPPSPTKVVDINGVNLISGSPAPNMPTLSSAGLSEKIGNIGVTWQGRVTDYSDSFIGYISSVDTSPSSSNESGNAPIVIGDKSFQLGLDIFAGDCVSSICTYWDKDGTAYLFDTTKTSDPFDGIAKKLGMLVQINKPDGEIIKITLIKSYLAFATSGGSNNNEYTVHVVASYYPSVVVSSNGWMARYEYTTRSYTLSTNTNTFTAYVPQKIYLINTAVDYCDLLAASCTSSNASHWPTWNITYPNVYKDVSGTLIGNFRPESYTLPSGVTNYYWTASVTHRVTDAFIKGMHTTYAYNWADGTGGTVPYIITATKPDGASYSARSEKFNYQYSNTVVNDFTYFYLDQPSMFTDENGRVTKYEYNSDDTAYRADNRSLKRVISPEATYNGSTLTGGYTEYGYDSRRNVTSVAVYPKGGGAALMSYYAYETTCTSATYIYCNKLKTYTDPNGNVTTYTYSTVHGQVLTETGPAGADGVHTQKRYTYTPLYAKTLNASGGLTPSVTPIYRLTKTSTCRSATAADPASCVTSNPSQEVVTEYEYNTNNLLLTKVTVRAGNANVAQPYSATNVWVSTSYTYDGVGNRLSVDGPRTLIDDKSYTAYDVLRRPVYEIGPDPDGAGALPRVIVHHMYDDDGREYRTENGTGTAIDGSDFAWKSYSLTTYDGTTGLPVKTVVAQQ